MLHQHLEKLRGFLGVATHGSFRKAAEILAISQPSLSQSIATLEEALGVNLFTRSSRGVELTPEGMRLHTFALEVMAMTAQVEDELTRGNTAKEWTLSVGSYESLTVHLWPRLLRYLQKENERLQINLISGRSSSIIKELLDGFLDAALCVDPPPNPRMEQQLLYEDSFGIFGHRDILGPPDHEHGPWIMKKSELFQHVGFVFSTASAGLGRTLEQLLWTMNIRFKSFQIVQSFEGTAALIEARLGLGILPHRIASSLKNFGTHLKEVSLSDCENDWGLHRVELCYLKDTKTHAPLKSLKAHLHSWRGRLDQKSLNIR